MHPFTTILFLTSLLTLTTGDPSPSASSVTLSRITSSGTLCPSTSKVEATYDPTQGLTFGIANAPTLNHTTTHAAETYQSLSCSIELQVSHPSDYVLTLGGAFEALAGVDLEDSYIGARFGSQVSLNGRSVSGTQQMWGRERGDKRVKGSMGRVEGSCENGVAGVVQKLVKVRFEVGVSGKMTLMRGSISSWVGNKDERYGHIGKLRWRACA